MINSEHVIDYTPRSSGVAADNGDRQSGVIVDSIECELQKLTVNVLELFLREIFAKFVSIQHQRFLIRS